MGGVAHLLALARRFAVHGFPAATSSTVTKRDRALVLTLAACRDAGARRRAHRAAGPDARRWPAAGRRPRIAERWPPAKAPRRSKASLPPKARLSRFSGADPGQRFSRSARGHRRSACTRWRRAACRATSSRCWTRPKRHWPIRAAWSSGRPKAASAGSRIGSRRCATTIARRLAEHRAAHRGSLAAASAGRSSCITRTGPPPSRCSRSSCAAGRAGDYRWKPDRWRREGRHDARARSPSSVPGCSAGLLALPVIWWLLRTVPPRPQRIDFPPTRILVGIENKEKTPAKTPWWLTLIRMLAAALVILALAEPVLNPNRETALTGTGPVVLVVDNGWAAAAHWPTRTPHGRPADRRSRRPKPAGDGRADGGTPARRRRCARSRRRALPARPQPPCSRSLSRRTAPAAVAASTRARAAAAKPASSGWPTASTMTTRPALSPTSSRRLPGPAASVVVEVRPGEEALGAARRPWQRRQARGAGAARRRRAAQRRRCMPSRRAGSGWARRRSRSTRATRARSPASTCRSSSGTR